MPEKGKISYNSVFLSFYSTGDVQSVEIRMMNVIFTQCFSLLKKCIRITVDVNRSFKLLRTSSFWKWFDMSRTNQRK